MEKISVLDRSVVAGDGVFTSVLVKEGKIAFLDDHLKRLKDHAEAINLEFSPIDHNQITHFIQTKNGEKGLFKFRILITGGVAEEPCLPKRKGEVVFLLEHLSSHPQEEIKLIPYSKPLSHPLSKVKTLSYLPRYYLKDYAMEHKADDCIVTDHQNHVLDTSFANLFWIHKDHFFYPDPELNFLSGITIQYLIKAAKKLGLIPSPGKYLIEHMKDSYVFIASSLVGFKPVKYIDEHELDRNRKLEKALLQEYEALEKRHHFDLSF